MDERITKFDDTEIEKYKFHQRERAILINNIDVNKIVYLIKVLLVKKFLNVLLVHSVHWGMDILYVYYLCIFLPKMGVCRRILIKLNVCLLS